MTRVGINGYEYEYVRTNRAERKGIAYRWYRDEIMRACASSGLSMPETHGCLEITASHGSVGIRIDDDCQQGVAWRNSQGDG